MERMVERAQRSSYVSTDYVLAHLPLSRTAATGKMRINTRLPPAAAPPSPADVTQ
jgi:hypothetical protein